MTSLNTSDDRKRKSSIFDPSTAVPDDRWVVESEEPAAKRWEIESETPASRSTFDPSPAQLDDGFDPSTARPDDDRPSAAEFLDAPRTSARQARRGGTRREMQTAIDTPDTQFARGKGGQAATDPRRLDREPDGDPIDSLNERALQGLASKPSAPDALTSNLSPGMNVSPARKAREDAALRATSNTAPGSIQNTDAATAAGIDVNKALGGSAGGAIVKGGIAGLADLGKVGPGFVTLLGDLTGSQGVTEFGKEGSGMADRFGDQSTAGNVDYLNKTLGNIARSIVTSLPMLGAGAGGETAIVAGKVIQDAAAVRAMGRSMGALFTQTFGQEYGDARRPNNANPNGFDPVESAARAGIFGAAEVIGEMLGFKEQVAILKNLARAKVPTGQLAKVLSTELMKEVPGEELTTLTQFLADKYGPAAMNPHATLHDYLQQAADTAVQTIGQGLAMGGGAMARRGVRNLVNRAETAINQSAGPQAQAEAEAAGAINDAVDNTHFTKAGIDGYAQRAGSANFYSPGQVDPSQTVRQPGAVGPSAPVALNSADMPDTPITPEDFHVLRAAADQEHADHLGIPEMAQHASLDGITTGPNRPVAPPEAGNQGPSTSPAAIEAPVGRQQAAGQVQVDAQGLEPGQIRRGSIADAARRQVESRAQHAEGAAIPAAPKAGETRQEDATNRVERLPVEGTQGEGKVKYRVHANQQPAHGSSMSTPAAPNASVPLASTTTSPADEQGRRAQHETQDAYPTFQTRGQAVTWSVERRMSAKVTAVKAGDGWTLQPRAAAGGNGRSTVSTPTTPTTTAAGQTDTTVAGALRAEAAAGESAATHAEPGQRSEPANSQVVSASMDKAASNEGRRPSEMRNDLVVQIDRTMDSALADDHPDVVQYEREARSKPDRAKLQRQGLVGAKLEARSAGVQNEIDLRKARVADRIGFVEFDVPGDGKFKVLHTKARLAEFKSKVMASPGFKASQQTKTAPEYPGAQRGSPSTKAAIEAMIDDGDSQAAVDYAHNKGVDIRDMGLSPARLAMLAGVEPTKATAGPEAEARTDETQADAPQRGREQDDAVDSHGLSASTVEAAPADDGHLAPSKPAELTQAQFLKRVEFRNAGSGSNPWTAWWGDTQLEGHAEEFDHPDLGRTVAMGGQFFKTRREAVSAAKQAHERAVRRSALNGHQVSPDVLADYPSLQQFKGRAATDSAAKAETDSTAMPKEGVGEPGVSREAQVLSGLIVTLPAPNPATGQIEQVRVDAGRFIVDYDERIAAVETNKITIPEDQDALNAHLAELVAAGKSPSAARAEARSDMLETLRAERDEVIAAARRAYPAAADELDDHAGTTAPARVEDAGEKIGGARKDRWKARGLAVADLDSMSESEGAELATKANVWKPDYAAMVASGTRPKVAALVKVVFDSLAAKPKSNTPEGRRRYVTAMQAVREVYGAMGRHQQLAPSADTSDATAMRRAAEELRQKLGVQDADPVKARDAKTTLFSVYKGRSDPFAVGYAEEARAAKLIDSGFPGKVEPWTRRFEISKAGGAGSTVRGVAAIVKQAEDLGTPVTAEQAKAGVFMVIGKTDRRAKAMAANLEDAEAAAQALYDRDLAAKGDGKQAPERPHLDILKREGMAPRIDRDVTPEDFLQTFGFRGVEFGNWAANDERQRLLNMAFDGLQDLAEIIGVPPKALSLNGSMGMAFGARGGGRFAAHYEPGRLVINMTKLQGGGSLAHEFAHALDHYFGELDRPDAYQSKARGATGWYEKVDYSGAPQRRFVQEGGKWVQRDLQSLPNLRPEVAYAFRSVMRALFQKQVGKAEAVRELELEVERLQARAESEQNPELKAAIERSLKAQQQNLAESRQEPEDATHSRGRSDFAKEAQKLSGKSANGYWTRPTEMFARAFESYVFDRLLAMGAKSDYLVHGVESDRFAGGNYKGNPYPAGTERADIDRAFDRLFAAIQTRETDKGVAMFQRTQQGTPEFKSWFAGSKVVDEQGQPKVMYHGTGADITAFRAKQAGAIFVTEEPIFAQAYADTSSNWMAHRGQDGAPNILPVYVKATNPFDYADSAQVEALRAHLDEAGLWKTQGELDSQLQEPDNWSFLESGPMQEAIKALGHDGFYVSEGGFKNLAVYEPTQLKSAIGNGGQFDPNNADIRMARHPDGRSVGSLSPTEVQSIVDKFTTTWSNAPTITVLDSMAEAPPAARRANEAQLQGGATGVPSAFYMHGRVYLVAGELRNERAVAEALLHEVLGHHGLRGVFGAELGKVLTDLADSRPELVAAKAAQYGLDTTIEAHRQRAAEEVLAELAQTEPKLSLVKRAIAAIRGWLREHMPLLHNLELSDEEIVANFIVPARQFVIDGGQARATGQARDGGQVTGTDAAFDRSLKTSRPYSNFRQWLADNPDRDFAKLTMHNASARFEQRDVPLAGSDVTLANPGMEQTETPEFKAWFKGSKVVDENGKPLRLFHGTAADISRFRVSKSGFFGAGIYLTSDAREASTYADSSADPETGEGANVMPVFASLQNPYVVKGAKFEMPEGWTPPKWMSQDMVDDMLDNFESPAGQLIADVIPEASAKQMLTSLFHGKTAFGDTLTKRLQAMGHDGLIVHFADPADGSTEYIAFDPKQVKSAIGNRGTFDPDSADIRFQRLPADFTLREFGQAGQLVEVVQDRYNRWKQVIDDVRKQGGMVTDESDFYKAEERYWGKVGTKLEDFHGELKTFVNEVARDGLSLDDVAIYAVAMHAEERNEAVARKRPDLPDGGSGMTTDEADAILESARQAGLDPALKAHAETLRKWIQGTREVLHDGGLIGDDEYRAWMDAYEHYVPLRGIDGQRLDFGPTRNRWARAGGFNIKGDEGHEAQGRHSQAKHIIETVIQDRAKALIRVGKNEVLRSFAQFVIDNPSPSLWTIETVETKDATIADDTGDRTLPEQPAFGDDCTITMKDAGQEIRIKVLDERLLRQLRLMDVEANPSWVVGALQWANRKLSHVYTTLSPTFTVVNGLRDAQAAVVGIIDEIGFMAAPKLLAKLPMSLYEAWRAEAGHKSADYQLYAAMGGQTHYFNLKSLAAQADDLQRLVRDAERSPVDPRTIAQQSLALIEAINGGIENATRLAAFKVAREAGKSTVQAASIAKNLTVNFNRRGTQQLASAWFLFFNPAVQDFAMGTRRLANPKVLATLSTAMLGIAALALRNVGMGDDDDGVAWWDKIPDETKERNIIIVLPPGSKAGEAVPGSKIGRYVKIPMPYYFSMFPVLANQIVDVWRHGQDPKRGRDLLHGAVKTFNGMMSAVMPVPEIGRALSSDSKEAAGKSLVLAAVPDALNPIAQNALNMSGFGRKLRPDGPRDRNMPDSATYFPGQAGTLFQRGAEGLNKLTGGTKYSSGMVDMAPASMENLVRSYGGGPVGFALDLVNAMYARQSIARPDLDPKKLPFVKQFYAQIDAETDRLTGYQRLESAEKITDPIKHAMSDGSAADAKALFKEAGPMAALGNAVQQTRQQLGQIVKAELALVNGDKPDDIKFVKLQALAERRRLVLQSFNRAYDKAIELTATRAEQQKAKPAAEVMP